MTHLEIEKFKRMLKNGKAKEEGAKINKSPLVANNGANKFTMVQEEVKQEEQPS